MIGLSVLKKPERDSKSGKCTGSTGINLWPNCEINNSVGIARRQTINAGTEVTSTGGMRNVLWTQYPQDE